MASALVVGLVVYVPFLSEPFGTHPLGAVEVAIVVGLALVPAAVLEALKAARRRSRAEGIRGNPDDGMRLSPDGAPTGRGRGST